MFETRVDILYHFLQISLSADLLLLKMYLLVARLLYATNMMKPILHDLQNIDWEAKKNYQAAHLKIVH